MSRIHNARDGWTLTVRRDMMNVGYPSMNFMPVGALECELEIDVVDTAVVRKLTDYGLQRDVSVTGVLAGWYRVRLQVTEEEASAIARGVPPLEALFPTPGLVRAVPDDLSEFR
jgi:hypothetical protein